jgi:hypothetical protein
MHDKLVKRGLTVSWYALRGQVLRVRTGRCLVRLSDEVSGRWLPCSSVYVVPS